MSTTSLPVEVLRRRFDPEKFALDGPERARDLEDLIGQRRVAEAMRFGIGMRRKGYNLFALGPSGTGKFAMIDRYLAKVAADEAVPTDWCYVHNFDDWRKPHAIRLPAGRGAGFKKQMERLVIDLHQTVSMVFESDEYRARSQALRERFEERQQGAVQEIQKKAAEKSIVLIKTPTGFSMGPKREDTVLGPEEFQELPEEERVQVQADINELQDELRETLHDIPQWKKESREEIDDLCREMTASSAGILIDALRPEYDGLPRILEHLQRVEQDVVDNFQHFMPQEEEKLAVFGIGPPSREEGPRWDLRYRVNLLVAHEDNGGAPVVYEDLPAYNNLVGRIEHRAHMGALETDFTMIRAGALHRANGGYLILDAVKVMTQQFSWQILKRVLQSREIRIEALAQVINLISTESLEPEAIPLDVKVILIGDRRVYYLLNSLDPEFSELFKVAVDFDDRLDWDEPGEQRFVQLVSRVVREKSLRPFAGSGVARIVERAMRLAGDNEKLTSHMRSVVDLMQDADYWAGENGSEAVTGADVQQAVDAQIQRAGRIRERLQEEVLRGSLLIDTEGTKVGQVNGLSVVQVGGFAFGRPTRITARARLGRGQLVDIEREVELGGPLHSKGILILTGFVAGRYAPEYPLSLSASLVFEQSYGTVDGDSASSAELYALLSALAGLPVRQSLAVTGSVNQLGEVQAIGGVNDKIEGFFDICNARGLTGEQGVLIPASNVKHLMLRDDVVEAAAGGRFNIYPIATIDEGIELLTGVDAGQRGSDGEFPNGSVNYQVEETLVGFSRRMRALGAQSPESGENEE